METTMNEQQHSPKTKIDVISWANLIADTANVQPLGEPKSSLQPALAELTRFFIECRVWFNQKLPLPVITIQPAGKRQALGWFIHKRWQQAHLGNRLDEINICAEHLAGDLDEIAHTLIHEMVHYANARRGVKDCNANQYHNRRFRDRALEIGLGCGPVRHRRFGWGITHLTDVARQRIKQIALQRDAFLLFSRSLRTSTVSVAKPKPKLQKWVCDCENAPGVWRATGTPLNNQCLDCGSVLRPFRL